MSKSPGGFDPIGIVVDWIDACRHRQLSTLVELYDDAAVVDCCEGGRFRGRAEVARYWRPKLIGSGPSAFEIDALMPEVGDYRGHDGKTVRTHFRLSERGKIVHTACVPVQRDAPDWAAA